MAEEIILKVGVEGIGEGETKIKSLKAQLRDMKNELLGLDEGSDRFKTLSKQAGELTDKIGDVSDKVKALSSDTKKLDALVGVGSAIAGGFQAAQGAMALFGSDSKKVEEAIRNIIAVQGILNGVQQVGQFLTAKGIVQDALASAWKETLAARTAIAAAAQRVYNLVISQNPLFIYVSAIIAVVGAFALFKKGADASAAGQKALNEAIEEGDKAVAKEEATLKILTGTIASNTSSLREKKNAIKDLNALAPEYLGNITLENIGTQESISAIKEYISSIRTKIELQALEAQLQETISERLSLTRKLQNDELSISEAIRIQEIQAEEDAILAMIQLRQNETKEIIKGSADVAGAELEKKHTIESTNNAEVESAEDKAARLAEIERLRLEAEVQSRIEDAQAYQDFLQRNLDADNAYNLKVLEEKKARIDAEVQMEYDKQAAIQENAEINDQKEKERKERNLKTAQDFANASVNLVNTVFTLTNKLGKQDDASKEARAKRQFQISKTLQLGLAVLDGYKAITSSLALSPVAILGVPNPAGIASLAFAIATTTANIAKIASSTYGGGASDSSVATPNISSSSGDVGNTTPNITPINAGSTFLNQEPQKVYVLESDITNTQNGVSAIVKEATF